MQLTILSLCVLLVRQTVWGMHFTFGSNDDYKPVSTKPLQVEKSYYALLPNNENFEVNNSSLNTTAEGSTDNSPLSTNDSAQRVEENNSTLSSSSLSVSSAHSTSAGSSTSYSQNLENLTTISSNESHSQSSTELSSSKSSAATKGGTMSGTKSSTLTTPSNNETNANSSTTDDDETEGVARGKPSTTESVSTTTAQPQTLFEKSLALVGDPYTLSIVLPIIAGVVFATAILVTIATCKCIKRRCTRSRRLRRKALPDSVKNLRPSDRARLLAESSDEEF